jgi:hypothetical protein
MFLAIRTRPDILKEVIYLSTFSLNPGPIARMKLYRVVGYIRHTPMLGIKLNTLDPILSIYCDASFGTHANGKSHSGFVITFGENGGPLLVKSHVQQLVSTSSTESELICLVAGIKRVLPILSLVKELELNLPEVVQVYEDNMSCIKIATDGSNKGKFFRVRYNFIKELLDSGIIELQRCPSNLMLADLCTKPIGGQAFRDKRDNLLNVQTY